MLGHYHQLLTAFYISRCRCNCICGACNYLKTEWWPKIKVITETYLLLEPHNINTNMHALEVIMIFLSDNIRSRIVSCFRTGLILFAISFIFFILSISGYPDPGLSSSSSLLRSSLHLIGLTSYYRMYLDLDTWVNQASYFRMYLHLDAWFYKSR